MESRIFNEIEKLFELSNDEKYKKSVELLTKKDSSEDEKKLARGYIVYNLIIELRWVFNDNIVYTRLSNSEISSINIKEVRPFISDNDYEALIKLSGDAKCENNDITFYDFLYKTRNIFQKAYQEFTISSLLDRTRELANRIGNNTIPNLLKGVYDNTALHIKKRRLIDALDELNFYVKTETFLACNKIVNPDARKEIHDLTTETRDCITTILLSENDEYASVWDMTTTLLNDEEYQYHKYHEEKLRKIEKKEMDKKKKMKDKNEKKENKLFKLIKTPIFKKTIKPVKTDGAKIKVKDAIKIGATGFIIGGLIFAVTKCSNDKVNKNVNNNINNKPSTQTEVISYGGDQNTVSTMDVAKVIQNNWSSLGAEYSLEEINELVKLLNGYESSIDLEIADSMLLDAINNATIAPINNIIVGEDAFEGKKVEMSKLFIKNQAGIEAVKNMENNLNGSITDTKNLKTYATNALKDEVRVTGLNETVDGLNMTTTDPNVRLVWSRLAIGMNAISGTLGNDFKVTVGDNTYRQIDINNAEIFEQIAREAKSLNKTK